MDKRIALVNPPISEEFLLPPLGLAYIHSILKQKGYKTKIYNLDLDLYKGQYAMYNSLAQELLYFYKEDFYENISKFLIKPETFSIKEKQFLDSYISWVQKNYKTIFYHKYILITTTTDKTLFALLLAKLIKQKNKKSIIILGGPETIRKKEFLIKFDFIDFLVLGEGKDTVEELVYQLHNKKNFRKIKGIVFKKNGKIKITEPNLSNNLDNFPVPDFKGFSIGSYPYKIMPIRTSRGCPYNCTFCSDPFYGGAFRVRDPDKVVSEIKYQIKKYKISNFIFCENLINGDSYKFFELCRKIKGQNLKINLVAFAKPRLLSYKMLAEAAKAGFKALVWGIESGSQKVIDEMNKNISLNEVEEVLKFSGQCGIKNHCCFIVAYPTETKKDLILTKKFISKNRKFIDSASVNICKILEFANIKIKEPTIQFKSILSYKQKKWRREILLKKLQEFGIPNMLGKAANVQNADCFMKLFKKSEEI